MASRFLYLLWGQYSKQPWRIITPRLLSANIWDTVPCNYSNRSKSAKKSWIGVQYNSANASRTLTLILYLPSSICERISRLISSPWACNFAATNSCDSFASNLYFCKLLPIEISCFNLFATEYPLSEAIHSTWVYADFLIILECIHSNVKRAARILERSGLEFSM